MSQEASLPQQPVDTTASSPSTGDDPNDDDKAKQRSDEDGNVDILISTA
jgi:hypothetical protein